MIHIVTIALNAMPWITLHYPEFRKLRIPWTWHVVEGQANAEKDTAWCKAMPPTLSTDGTREYLNSLRFDTRVNVIRKALWHGKVAMVNAPLRHIYEESILLQVDADEIWTAHQIETLVGMFAKHPEKNCAYFYCRYFLGPDIVTTVKGAYGNNDSYEWHRAWRFSPGMYFQTHEPPVLHGLRCNPFTQSETEAMGIVFDHYSWATEAQVKWKSGFYNSPNNPVGKKYEGAVEGWRRLQENQRWPVKVQDYLPWVDDRAQATRL